MQFLINRIILITIFTNVAVLWGSSADTSIGYWWDGAREQEFRAFVQDLRPGVDLTNLIEQDFIPYEFSHIPMRLAIYEYNEPFIKELLRRSPMLKSKCSYFKTPLMYALSAPLLDDDWITEELEEDDEQPWIDKVAFIKDLMKIADGKRLAMVRLLLVEGVHINAQNNSGMSALMYAAHAGCVGAVQLLLARNADTNMATHKGTTALAFALIADGVPLQNRAHIATMLLDAGADNNALYNSTPIKFLKNENSDGNRIRIDLLMNMLVGKIDAMIDAVDRLHNVYSSSDEESPAHGRVSSPDDEDELVVA